MVFFLFSLPAITNAHANLERSAPLQDAALEDTPEEIRIQFTEEFDTKLSQITLEDDQGNLISGKRSAADPRWLIYTIPKLNEGIYKVKWQVLSIDTHVTEGSYRFSVKKPLEKEKPNETISLDGVAPAPEGSGNSNLKPGTTSDSKPVSEPVQQNPQTKPVAEAPSSSGLRASADSKLQAAMSSPSDTKEEKDSSAIVSNPETAPKVEPTKEDNELVPVMEEGGSRQTNQVTPSEQQEGVEASKKQIEDRSISNSNEHSLHHNHHGSEAHTRHHSIDWIAVVQHFLRIFDVLVVTSITGFLFYRYAILWDSRHDQLMLFSVRNERLLYIFAFVGFVASGALHIWMLVQQLIGIGTHTFGELFFTIAGSTLIGLSLCLRLGFVGLMYALTFVPNRNERVAFPAKMVAGLGLILMFPLTGHAYGSSSGVWIAVLSHTVHMTVAAIWLGGLFGIWTSASAWTRDGFAAQFDHINALIRRFSAIALPAIVLVAISGIVLSLMRLSTWSALLISEYGRLVLAKICVLGVVIIIGFFHRFVFIPRMSASATEMKDVDSNLLKKFVLGVRMEVFLAVVLFILAGMLSTIAPPEKVIPSEAINWHVMGDKSHMSFRMNSEREKGQSFRLDIWLTTGVGAPEHVNAQIAKKNSELSLTIPFEYRTGGPDPYGFKGFDKFTYEANGNIVTEKGEWNVSITIIDSTDQVHRYEKTIAVS
ncbi:CopD family protein [Paenibacillus sp. sgz302251]|uniref:copper resistance CopC/CopD family protein n=1 Tax=Paenibacillus sp. sgz302251 TaxID=3414493 RepID=UPI003C7D1795